MHHKFHLSAIIVTLLISTFVWASSISLGKIVNRPCLYVDSSQSTLLNTSSFGINTVYRCTIVVKNPIPKAMNFRLKLSIPHGKFLGFKYNDTCYAYHKPYKSSSNFFIWPSQVGYFQAFFILKSQPKINLSDRQFLRMIQIADAKEIRLKPLDGIYIGFEPSSLLQPKIQWLHENHLMIKDRYVSMEKAPRYIEDGDLYASASTGGFYTYRGFLVQRNNQPYLDLTLRESDYGGIEAIQKNPLTGSITYKNGHLIFNQVVYRHREWVIADLVQSDVYQHYDQLFYNLGDEPLLAVPLLIKELHPIKEARILSTEFKNKPEAMHVIRCLRALRYITGQDFTAESHSQFGQDELEQNRKYWLTNGGKRRACKFFGTWMSRDSIYIAPIDVQKRIIEKWHKWYQDVGRYGIYKRNGNEDFWYF